MKPLIILFLITCTLPSKAQINFKIVGTTTEDLDLPLFLIIKRDTLKTTVVNKQFVFEGHVDGPTRVIMRSDNNCASQFFIDPTEMQMTTTASHINGTCMFRNQVTGSPTQALYDDYQAGIKKVVEKSKGVNEFDKAKDYAYEFVSKHPSSIVAAHIIQMNSRAFGYQWTKKSFEALADEQKNSLQGLDIQKTLGQHNLMRVGNTIADFSQKDIHDSLFHLSSLKGSYVLIDFWASWCGPCRKENPNVKKVYEKYHALGFEVVGVSLDNDGNRWKEAVKKDELPWIHISDLQGWNNEIATAFEINAIPSNILIDKQGKIIATNLRGGELDRTVKKLFQ